MMNKEKYMAISKELDAIPLDFFDPNLPIEKREKERKKYAAKWKEICAKYGVTVEEYDIELERSLDKKYGRVAQLEE